MMQLVWNKKISPVEAYNICLEMQNSGYMSNLDYWKSTDGYWISCIVENNKAATAAFLKYGKGDILRDPR